MSWPVDVALVVLGKGSLWLLAAALATLAWRRSSAAGRHLVWAMALFGLAFLPIAQWLLPSVELPWLPRKSIEAAVGPLPNAEVPVRAAQRPSPVLDAPSSQAMGWPETGMTLWRSLGSFLWALGSCLLFLRLVAGWAALRRLRCEADNFDRPEVRWVLAELGMAPDAVHFLTHPEARTPCTWGVLRPVVMLPLGVESWDRDCLRDVLVHELAHIERRDWLWSQAVRLVCALFFFQPLAWMAAARMAKEAELACDDRVLAFGTSAPDYAERLLGFAPVAGPALAPGALQMARSKDLSLRIAAILDPKLRRKAMTRFNIALLITVAAVLAVAIAPSRLVHAAGAEVRATQDQVPLLAAAKAGDLAEIARLIEAGEDVDMGVRGEGTPLILAARGGHQDAVKALLDAGADANLAETSSPRSIPRTPLGAAAAAADPVIAGMLLDAGADLEKAPKGDASPLMIAARTGKLPIVEFFLSAGADANRSIKGDGSVLIRAAGSGNVAVLERVLQAGADPNRTVSGDGSPLIRAASAGNVEIVEALLAAGADPNRSVRGDGSPMIAATRRGHGEIVELLIRAGAKANAEVRGDGNPLIQAARRGDRAMVENLLDAGADPDSAVRGDGSALIGAAASGHSEVVELLLNRGATIDQVVPGDENALIQAAASGQLEVAELLITRGADVNKGVRADGREIRTALSMALRGGHEDVVEMLLRHGARN